MSSEHDISLVTSQAGSVIAENQHVTLGTASSAITPATATAMVGINQNIALDIADSVKTSTAKLQDISGNVGGVYSAAQVSAAATALSTLNGLQSNLGFGGSPNHAAFGSFLSQAHNHVKDSVGLRQSTDFMANTNYSDFGSGITNMSSMADRGLTNQFGSFKGAGAAMASTGTMFNGIDVKNFGTPTGLVQSLQNNKLANATGVNQKLVDAGVDLNDLDNPVYKDQISNVLGSIKDPTAINTAADQYGITNPFAGLPSYSGSDASLYNTQNVFGSSASAPVATTIPTSGTSAFGAPTTTGFPTTTGSSTASTAFGASQAPDVGNAGGIQSLKDLSDYTKLANPSDTAGFTGGASGLASKFKDLGAGTLSDAGAAPDFFSKLQTTTTPQIDAAHPTLNSLITSQQSSFDSLTGSGSGPGGLPNMSDFAQHVGGGPDVTAFNSSNFSVSDITAYTSSMTKASSLWSTAGVDLTSPPPNGLGTSMTFATNLHKFGADKSGSGIADLLKGMANQSSKYGESIKASLVEGNNNKLLSLNGMGPIQSNPFEGLPAAQGENSLEGGAKLLGG